MSPRIIVFTHAPNEITKPHKTGLGYTVSGTGVCFGVLNGMKGQIIQRKTAIEVYKCASMCFVSSYRQ